ncbi:hypothetical protein DFQ26_005085 [Actinomortierella ambigua]|nr:hypothetical protein DFQ26_005085 [Actinomortierella ambigua]
MNFQTPDNPIPDFLYRLLRRQDDHVHGIYSTDPLANISIKDHVERGGLHRRINSQFISTTRDSEAVLRWLVAEREGTIAIISTRRLATDVSVIDLSSGYPTLDPYFDNLVRRHQEVLLTPIINEDAVICSVSYDDISADWEWNPIDEAIALYYSDHCLFCDESGHNDDNCPTFQELHATESDNHSHHSTQCSFCGENGHDDDDCPAFHQEIQATEDPIDPVHSTECTFCGEDGHNYDNCPAFEEELRATVDAIDPYRSTQCTFCGENGHNYESCLVVQEWHETDETIDQYNLAGGYCTFCRKHGHVDNSCPVSEEWHTTGDAIDRHYSTYCMFCNDHGHDETDCPIIRRLSIIDG